MVYFSTSVTITSRIYALVIVNMEAWVRIPLLTPCVVSLRTGTVG